MVRHAGHYRLIFRLGFPLLAGNLSMYLYRVADSIMVGRLGVEALAGMAYGTIYATVHEMLVWPVALGVQAIVSRRVGRRIAGVSGAEADTDAVLPQGLYAGLIAGSAALLLASLAPLILPLLTVGSARGYALRYVRISMWALPLMGLASGARGFLAGSGRTRMVMVAIILSNGVNVLANWVFIFGMLGAPALGIRGAALGTVIAHGVSLLLLAGAAVHHASPFCRPEGSIIRRVILIGLPTAVQNAMAMVVVLLFQGIVGTIGSMYVAVTHVLFSTFRINKTLVGGFANGAAILVGNFLGAERPEEARRVISAQMRIGAGIGSVLLVVILVASPAVGRLFALEGAALELAATGMRVMVPFFFVEILGYSLEIILSHNGWGRYVLVSEFITNLVGILGIPAVLVGIYGMGIGAAWGGFAVYQVLHALFLGRIRNLVDKSTPGAVATRI